jgi:hypothetical protein
MPASGLGRDEASLLATPESLAEETGDETLDQFMAADQLSNAIRTIEMRRRRREKTAQKLRT